MPRVLEPETLDHLAPDDPKAQRSRRDLRRVNRVMGAERILLRALRRVVRAPSRKPLRVLEIGCGDGLLLLGIAARLDGLRLGPGSGRDEHHDQDPDEDPDHDHDRVELTLLDRQPVVSTDTVAAYGRVGWRAETSVTDVLDWAGEPSQAPRWDVVVANLFLHHFDGDALARLLHACGRRADALVACEPRRSRFALLASHLVAFLGANAVTRRDAVLSVRAGFRERELGIAWNAANGTAGSSGWQIDEYDDGLFTHCFCAVRSGRAGDADRAIRS